MFGLFQRGVSASGPVDAGLGSSLVALAAAPGTEVPKGCAGLVWDARGTVKRIAAGQRTPSGHSACIFHPGPYAFDVTPYACAPEAGLHVELAVDTPDPRLSQQRFDLFLMSEAGERLELSMLRAALETALQRELEQGRLFLPPCTTIGEWNAFRLGVNQLVFTRFGMIVDDCLPVDLGGQVDFAAMLARRSEQAADTGGPVRWAARAAQAMCAGSDQAGADARALRRLFLELPSLASGLRLALPDAHVPFAARQSLLAQLDAASLSVETMPAYALAAPSMPLDVQGRLRRSAASLAALEALDECWALLARVRAGGATADALADDAERILANLASALSARRAAGAELEEA